MAERTEMLIRVNMAREANWVDELGTKVTIVMPSHILETFKKKMVSFLSKPGREYIIDPITYVFKNADDVADKQWFARLLAEYGMDMVLDPDEGELLPETLANDDGPSDKLKEMVGRVMAYQRQTVQDIFQEISEFENFNPDAPELRDTELRAPEPRWIIPPYFFIDPDKNGWLYVNTEAAKLAVARRQGKEKVFATIMLDSAYMMNDGAASSVLEAYNIDGLDGYMLWPVYLDENSATKPELDGFLKFVHRLSEYGKPIYSMYGGLFSFMMLNHGMSGVSHSICYGEHKIPFTGQGMMPTVRFYQPDLHSKIPLSRKEEVEKALVLRSCDCVHCAKLGGRHETDMALAGKHFLKIRESEVHEINKDSRAFLQKLSSAHDEACDKDSTGGYAQFYKRLEVWWQVMDGAPKPTRPAP